jgi:gluconokinase
MVIALDLGTSSARATLYDRRGRAVDGGFHQIAYEPATTPDGGVEHDPATLLEAAAGCLDAVTRAARHHEVQAVGVAAFWHGLLGFGAAGRPVTPLYMWADSRSAGEASLLRDALDEDALHARTGCHVHSSYWPAKLRWLARERPAELARIVRWGSIGEHLELALFGEAATSLSMASGTGLLDQVTRGWDAAMLAAAGIEASQLPPIDDAPAPGLVAPHGARWPALAHVPWYPAHGDGACSNVGSDCRGPQRVALNIGTSAALRVILPVRPGPDVATPWGLWRYRVDARRALLGGATSEGGNVLAWCRKHLALPGDSAALEAALEAAGPDGHGLTALPFLAGERSPGWRPEARAAIAGLSLDTGSIDIARALLESVAFRLAEVYDRLRPLASADHIVVGSGGALARSPAWTQIVADALGVPIALGGDAEASARGAALLALEALGVAVPEAPAPARVVQPALDRHARYQAARERQRRLYENVVGFNQS